MRRSPARDRVLATVLFTDIVGSTELASSLGDRRWRDLIDRHHSIVRAELRRFRGREIDTAGDGFFAVFDRPAAAIRCASVLIDRLRPLGIEIRAGVHTGEIERAGRSAGGIAVHIGSRIMATAAGGEIVVTSTVRDLVAGSGIEFHDRGTATLKGVDGEWRLFDVVREPAEPAVDAVDHDAPRQRRSRSPLAVVPVILVAGAAGIVALLGPGILAGPVTPGADSVGRLPAGATAFEAAVPVGRQPTGITVGGGAVWILNFVDGTLSRIDAASGAVTANPAIPGRPSAVVHGHGAAWVTTRFGRPGGAPGAVVRFDGRGRLEAEVEVGAGVDAIAADGSFVWVTDRIRDEVRRIDPATNRTVGEAIPVGRAPGAIAIRAGRMWVACGLDSTLWRIDPRTKEVERISLPGSPTAIAVGDEAVWVTSDIGGGLTRVDPTTLTVTTLAGLDGPRGVAVGNGAVWVAIGGGRFLARIDPATNELVARHPVAGVPDGVAIDADGTVWLTVRAP